VRAGGEAAAAVARRVVEEGQEDAAAPNYRIIFSQREVQKHHTHTPHIFFVRSEQKVLVENFLQEKSTKKQVSSIFVRCRVLGRFSARSSKTPLKTCKEIHVEKFVQENRQKKAMPIFFDLFLSHFGAFFGKGG
jgi:hypothetical protein